MGYYIHTVIVFVIGNTIRKAVVIVMIGNYIHRVVVIEGSLFSGEYGISNRPYTSATTTAAATTVTTATRLRHFCYYPCTWRIRNYEIT